MATRGSAARRVPGNPLGGILRDAQRKSRAVTGPRGSGAAQRYAGALTTGSSGSATVDFPVPFLEAPAVTATAESDTPRVVTIGSVSATAVTLVAWELDGSTAGSGVVLHVNATERT